MRYDHQAVEKAWQARWDAEKTFATPTDRTKPKFYVLDMFPYPSGSGLHVGHPKGYVATDIVARAKRMLGFNVLRVMGWDSFGLPSERQAVREGIHPQQVTDRNVARFKEQLSILGLSYDWDRELATSDARYYKWTQWIFLKLYDQGLAYQQELPVNWCPALGTVLSNEEVVDGKYVETGDPVERRLMKQWVLRITEYADKLLDGLDGVDWPDDTLKKQINWIGKSHGAHITFPIADHDDVSFEVFTTRPDTLFGCTYVTLAPEHPLVDQITTADQADAVRAYKEAVARMSERDRTTQAVDAPKTGAFTGAYAVCPVNGKKVPVWIADYVLAHYGTGAVFACPGHDERDHAFARQFDLPILRVVEGGADDIQEAAWPGDGAHVHSEFLDGKNIADAKQAIIAWLEEHGHGSGATTYKLRDWLFSRQRYWGEPFPIIELEDGSIKALPESALPVLLPHVDAYKPTEDGRPPLARAQDWVTTTDPETGAPARRETNTMPQWAGSCWYYLRFISPDNDDAAWDAEEEKYWMPVDLYVGGNEHAVLHLLYARFWHQVLYDLGHVSTPEPFMRLFHQGMIHDWSYRDERGKYYYPEQIKAIRDGEEVPLREALEDDTFVTIEGALPVVRKLEKMSKSRYNVVTPDQMCEQYGADAMRLYELFMGPLEDGNLWETAGVAGTRRFLDRTWRLVVDQMTGERPDKLVDGEVDDKDLDRALHTAIKRVTESVDSLRFNTAIAAMMEFVNAATRAERVSVAQIETFILVLSPFAPHLCEELWQRLGHADSLAYHPFPAWEEAKLAVDTITIAVQVQGKMRSTIEVAADATKDDILASAKADDNVVRYLEGKTIRREIYVPGRLVNLVVG